MDKRKTGELIRVARMRKNYTQTELGELIGVTNKAVSRWENGESFPDIGVLESLSEVLGLKIQDMVTGEAQADHETAVTEVVRIAKLQKAWNRKKRIQFFSGLLFLGYSIIIGAAPWVGAPALDRSFAVLSTVSMGILLILMLGNGSRIYMIPEQKADRIGLLVSSVLACLMILGTGGILLLAGRGITLFHRNPAFVGLFLRYQIMTLFCVDLVIVIRNFSGILRDKRSMDAGDFIATAGIYLTALYGDMLHRLSSPGQIAAMYITRTMLVAAEVAVALLAAIVLRKWRTACNYKKEDLWISRED